MALITTKETGLPLCSHIYEGNKNDQTAFFEYIDILKKRIPGYNPQSLTLIFDGGSNNKKNFDALETHYICSFSLSYCKNLYEIDLSEYDKVTVNSNEIRCYRLTQEVWGVQRECVLTYSNSLYIGQTKELNENIETAICSLKELNDQLENPKSRISKTKDAINAKISKILNKKYLNEIFEIKIKATNDNIVTQIEYLINETSKQKISHKYFGKKLIITDQKEWSTFEILKTYREQDCIEKIFRSTKNNDHCAICPQFHYIDQKIRVHIFCCILGLTLATILHKEVAAYDFKCDKFRMLDTLHGIRRCWIKDKNSNVVTNVLEEMDDSQTSLWNILQAL